MTVDREPSPELSIIMPAYNEAEGIEGAIQEVIDTVFPAVDSCELVVVDDGSKDRTGEILDRLAQAQNEASKEKRLVVVHKPNAGHGPALRTGLDKARGAYFLLIDSDAQISMEAFPQFWARRQEYDAILGMRKLRHDPIERLLLTRLVRFSILALFGVNLRDANVPFKLVSADLWKKARPSIPEDTLAPSIFLAIYAKKQKQPVLELEIVHRKRNFGVSSIRHTKLLKFCARAFEQLLSFRSTV